MRLVGGRLVRRIDEMSAENARRFDANEALLRQSSEEIRTIRQTGASS